MSEGLLSHRVAIPAAPGEEETTLTFFAPRSITSEAVAKRPQKHRAAAAAAARPMAEAKHNYTQLVGHEIPQANVSV